MLAQSMARGQADMPGAYSEADDPGVVCVLSSDGATYYRVEPFVPFCPCAGFSYRGHCRHLPIAQEYVRQNRHQRLSQAINDEREHVHQSAKKDAPAPSGAHFGACPSQPSPFNERGEYTGPLAEAFDRPMRRARR